MAEIEVTGEFPTGDVLFASCDSKYFNEFGIPLVYSCNIAGNDLHIQVIISYVLLNSGEKFCKDISGSKCKGT